MKLCKETKEICPKKLRIGPNFHLKFTEIYCPDTDSRIRLTKLKSLVVNHEPLVIDQICDLVNQMI